MLFTSLPLYVLYPVLSRYIELDSLCKLDSALCNSKQRKNFIVCLKHENLTFQGFKYQPIPTIEYVSWLNLRHVKVNAIQLQGKNLVNDEISIVLLLASELFSKLKFLRIEQYAIEDDYWLCNATCYMPLLTVLQLTESSCITDNIVSNFCQHSPNITELSFYRCSSITDNAMNMIATQYNSQLLVLNIALSAAMNERCQSKLTTKSIQHVAKHCSSLQYLNVGFCQFIQESDMVELCSKSHNLRGLNIVNCYQLGLQLIMELIRSCVELQVIDARWCYLTEPTILLLANNCPSLTKIGLCNGYMVSDTSVCTLAMKCRQLNTLHLGYCYAITNYSISMVAIICSTNLTDLNVSYNYNIFNTAIYALCKHCINMRKLNICGCFHLTSLSVFRISHKLLVLRELRCSKFALYFGVKMLQWYRPEVKIYGEGEE